ncbi:glycoside hydrolase family 20 protein [Pinibacter aurantiacus]|uniref:beta-N-acetylhexosaminidase n=1 Tax=Pinibacter aurantiacus TaxID=2851599 RepID=A0A9E2W839_9BACT|nr:glycoside hydrolase family 20 protein [Pinibacter aurantiacus]MBV4357497.1 family 20 glycosylhydrolase [Pinibacter aurantiacus]
MKYILLLACFIPSLIYAQTGPSIIPRPVSMQMKDGSFVLDKDVAVYATSKEKPVQDVVRFFSNYIKQISGLSPVQNKAKTKSIQFSVIKDNELGEEGYKLSVKPSAIIVQANNARGLFYAVQSLMQTLPAVRTNQILQIPCMDITDYPRFKWRGLMLDVSRHFFAPELVKEFIDLLASYKMNVFHWHLVDGAGWRIEIKRYPKLTQQAAWRVDEGNKTWSWGEVQFNADRSKATYGGYYTQEQIKEIVAYAKARQITIVPEIEMPGHSEAAMAAYPELSCTPLSTFGQSGNFYASKAQSNYCAGNDSAFVFLQNVLTEVMALFPSTYIHVGGDEVDKTSWKNCPKCQARMHKEGLKNEEELQSYFMKRIEKFVISKHRKMIGWDEILEGGLAPEATVMSWRGESGGIAAAQQGHNVVMTPGTPCYFDHYQGDPETEPLAIGGFNTLRKVYNYEPIPVELKPDEAVHVLGAQANLWTEYIPTFEHAEYMILPRMLALSEVVWSPKETRNWESFYQRLQPHLFGFEQKGLHYSKGNFKVDIKPTMVNGKLFVTLGSENPQATIRYTTDGSTPNSGSAVYQQPIEINKSVTVKALMAVDKNVVNTKPSEQSFTVNKATGKTVQYENANSRYYAANGPNTLTDGIRGTKEIGKNWHAFNGNDMVATIDFEKQITADSISLGCLQNYGQWIFFPQWVKFEVSSDGKNFTAVDTVINTVPPGDRTSQIQTFVAKFNAQSIRAVRVTAKNLGVCPPGHSGENQPAWLFCDEIIVE